MNTGEIGAAGELLACAWLLSEGYVVFRNVSPVGFADIVAYKDGKPTYIDVKVAKPRENGRYYGGHLSENQQDKEIRFVLIDIEKMVCLGFKDVLNSDLPTTCIYCSGPLKRSNQKKYCSKKCRLECTSLQSPLEKFIKVSKPKYYAKSNIIYSCGLCSKVLKGKQKKFCAPCAKNFHKSSYSRARYRVLMQENKNILCQTHA